MRSYLLAILGRAEESRQLAKRGAELSPHSLSIWIHSGFDQGGAMRPTEKIEEGIARLEKMVETNPEYPPAHESLGFAYYRNSRTAEAVAEMRKAVTLSKDDTALKAGLAFLLALAGQRDEATSILKTLQLSSRTTYVSNVQMACILYGLGRKDEAFDNLETAYKRREIDLPDIRMIPEMSELRADPRWTSIENRMGLRDM
jgi:tetratricopeptide (TPR) repeat protein